MSSFYTRITNYSMYPHVLILLLIYPLSIGHLLTRTPLTRYTLAVCNDGTTAVYYSDKEVFTAGNKVIIYLPDGGDCGSIGDCRDRCKEEPGKCSAPDSPVLQLEDGIWSSNSSENPFAGYFKVYIHYCSSDNFAGTRGSSTSTGNFYFHGKHILSATLQDLVNKFEIEKASSVVLTGSGSGGKGVGYNCDYVNSFLTDINPGLDVRCLADAPDLVPWWVKTEPEECSGEDFLKQENEKYLWAREDDDSCVETNEDIMNSSTLAHRCGLISQYWQDIRTPIFLIASQLDSVYYEDSPCTPNVEHDEYEEYTAAWRRGVVALAESIQAKRPNNTSIFIPSCTSHTLLTGSLSQVYWDNVHVPVLQGDNSLTLREMIARWLRSDYQHAVDPLGKENSQCPSPSPLRKACGNLLGCGSRKQSVYHPETYRHRLLPPTSLFPTSYSRKCSLDPWYGSCGRRTIGVDHGSSLGAGHAAGHSVLSLNEAARRKRLWQTLYQLQYLKKLYNKYKAAYAREYHGGSTHSVQAETHPVVLREKAFPAIFRKKRPRVVIGPRRVPSVVTVERPPVSVLTDVLPSVEPPDYTYDYTPAEYDYALYDYAEYYDYGLGACDRSCALSKIIKAVSLRKKNKSKTSLAPKVNNDTNLDEELIKSFKDFLSETNVDYEDFGSLSSQVETLDKDLLKLKKEDTNTDLF